MKESYILIFMFIDGMNIKDFEVTSCFRPLCTLCRFNLPSQCDSNRSDFDCKEGIYPEMFPSYPVKSPVFH